jgi:hypothetical protein
MRTIRLYIITANEHGKQFIINDYPELRLFESYSKRIEIKRLNIDQYFRGLHKKYNDHTKLIYGPVFGMNDPRNGFIYEHNNTGELVIADENDIPVTYEVCNVIMGDLEGIYKSDTDISKGIITSHNQMISLSNKVSNPQLYNQLIRDEWVVDKSFLIID